MDLGSSSSKFLFDRLLPTFLPVLNMSKAAELLQKAQALQSGDANRSAKRARSDNPVSVAMGSEGVTEILERVTRLTLQNSEKSEASACASNLVFLVKEPKDQSKLQEQVQLWVNTRPEWKAGASDNKPHELGEKRVFLFLSFLATLAEDPQFKEGPVADSLKVLMDLDTEQLSRWVASFKPRFSEPKAGRAWVWELSISALIPPEVASALDSLSATVDTPRWKIAPHRWGQTGLNKAVWDDLKKLAARRQ